jgi:large subunit ribosomal protein L35
MELDTPRMTYLRTIAGGSNASCLARVVFKIFNSARNTASNQPPFLMQKTKKSVAKRFKLTGTGKMMRRTPGFRHLLGAKSTKSKRRASRDKQVAAGHQAPLMRCLPFGL